MKIIMEKNMSNNMMINEYLPLREVVFNTLRDDILRGELEPGERLMEIHLAEKLGVSRTPVREAIRKLELEGLVKMIPRRGAVVASITISDLEDVLEVRKVLEQLTVKLACEKITDEEIALLKKYHEEFAKAINTNDLTSLAEKDVSFHDVIYNASHNNRLIQILNNLREQMYRYRLEYIKDRQKRKLLVSEHEKILNAVMNRDSTTAEAAIDAHIANQEKTIIENLNM